MFLVSIAQATPPPWAPAHGYRAKHGTAYDYDYRPDHDLGIASGRCNAEKVGAILGGVIGATVGSQVGDGDGRKAAVVIGTILGVIVGQQVGRAIDEKDRYCTGQALEHADNGQAVKWVNPDTHYSYQVTPLNHYLRAAKVPADSLKR